MKEDASPVRGPTCARAIPGMGGEFSPFLPKS
jgi:hypothetical protein